MTPELKAEHACCSCLLIYKERFFLDLLQGLGQTLQGEHPLLLPVRLSFSEQRCALPAEQLALKVGGTLPRAALTHFHGVNTLKVASFNLPLSDGS